MMENSYIVEKDDTFEKIINVFSKQVLIDFLSHIVTVFELPSAFFIYQSSGTIVKIEPKNNEKFLPELCRNVKSSCLEEGNEPKCTVKDKDIMKPVFERMKSNLSIVGESEIIECDMGISRLFFPIIIEDEILGGLVVGKFLYKDYDGDLIKKQLMKYVSEHCMAGETQKTIDNLMKNRIEKIVNCLDEEKVDKIASDIRRLLPLMKSLFSNNTQRSKHLNSIIFLNNLERHFPEIVNQESTLWKATESYLEETVRKFNLKSASLFYSKLDDKLILDRKILVSTEEPGLNYLHLASAEEFLLVAKKRNGLVIPRDTGHLSWLSENLLEKLFLSKSAILYSKVVFDGKLVILSYGFRDNIFLEDFEKLLLKKSALQLLKILNNSLASIETDYLMNDTGHLLRRAAAKIKVGFDTFLEQNLKMSQKEIMLKDFDVKKEDSEEVKAAKSVAIPAIQNGLFRLNLAIRNFKSFATLRKDKINIEKDNKFPKLEVVKPIELLEEAMRDFSRIIRIENKYFQKDFPKEVIAWKINTRKHLFELLLLNILDNAAKFSYSDTFIEIKAIKLNQFIHLKFMNLGIGISRGEENLVFERYYKSMYHSRSKVSVGTGVGLSFCKSFVELYFKDVGGDISIVSRQLNSRESNFDGDNYLTTITLILPC